LLYKNIKIKTYRIIILPVVLYGCETWSLTRRAKHWLEGVGEYGAGKTFGPKRDGLEKQTQRSVLLTKYYSDAKIV
jgi:hypothetical protein